MKILQINAVSGIRSTGRTCVEIADYLNDHDHEGYIAYSAGIPYKNGYRIGTPMDTKVHGLMSRLTGRQAYFSKQATLKLLEYLETIDPDVVHLRNLHGNYINLEIMLSHLAENDIPTVLTLHDCWFYTGKCCHYTVDGCYKWQSECFDCPRIHKDNPSWFLDRSNEMYRDKRDWFGKIPRLAVIGVSDWITNEAKISLLNSAKIVTRIYNWIDLEVFKPVNTNNVLRRLGLENQFIILGVASGWSNDKGLDKFTELAAILPEDMSIVMVGNMSESVHLPPKVIHIEETHDVNELIEYYSMADVLLNLSLEESFGKVTVEALACGTPAIVLNSTANPELVGPGCGYVLECNDMESIMGAIIKVKANDECSADNCIAYAARHFSKTDRINDYIHLYEQLIGSRELFI